MKLRNLVENINIESPIYFNRSMAEFTSFQIGGPADVLILCQSVTDLTVIRDLCRTHSIPFTLIGSGANILVSDSGIRGITVLTSNISSITHEGTVLTADTGASINDVCLYARDQLLSGLEFIYGMPGSIGGSIFMNARCYGVSLSERLLWVEYLDDTNTLQKYKYRKEDFGYKHSPFQGTTGIILRGAFSLHTSGRDQIQQKMDFHYNDREKKGHFRFPCAGSVFKNNRDFGEPTGKIIDSLGLKGYTIGGAQITDYHGNIIVNKGNATAADVRSLIDFVIKETKKHRGFILEKEVLYIGEW